MVWAGAQTTRLMMVMAFAGSEMQHQGRVRGCEVPHSKLNRPGVQVDHYHGHDHDRNEEADRQ
jgi:hypothetical protein